MKVAILSDIHGNLEALDAVLSDLDARQPDRIICLGDMIGYGPDPEAVVGRMTTLGVSCVMGNHEAALHSERDLSWMNFLARENNIATRALLSESSLAFCAALPRSVSVENGRFVHGCPPDSYLKYLHMVDDKQLVDLVASLSETRFFVGHTHELQLVSIARGVVSRARLARGRVQLESFQTYLINVGSVGHPRDGSLSAKYVIWDSDADTIEVRGVPYPAHKTADKIIARGFPKAYAIVICPQRSAASS